MNDIFDTTKERGVDAKNVNQIFDEDLQDFYDWVIENERESKSPVKYKEYKKKKKKKENQKRKITPKRFSTISDLKNWINTIICIINQIDENDDIVSDSILRWDDITYCYFLNTEIFKKRFLTLFLDKIYLNMKQIIKKDTEEEIVNLHHSICSFIKQIMIGDRESLYRDFSIISYSISLNEKNRKIYDELLSDGMKSLYASMEKEIPDDEIIYTIIRLAFLISTGDVNFNDLPKFKKIKGIKKEFDSFEIIARLGFAIANKKYNKRTPLYNAFRNASPLIKSNQKDVNRILYLNIGVRAIYLLGFITNDKKIRSFIYEFINS